jgi:hypothetical protein
MLGGQMRLLCSLHSMVLASVFLSQPAGAWQAMVQVSCETTIRGSSETSTAASRADQRDERRPAGSQCRQDEECVGWCREGQCVEHLTPTAIPKECEVDQHCAAGRTCQNFQCVDHLTPTPIPKECEVDQHCAAGRACQNFQCVDLPPVMAPPVPARCANDAQCQPGQSCANGQCLSLPPSPPSSSLQRRGKELYLRERAVQLRQDLALGEGPVISTLASMQGVSPVALGRVLRAHRAELVELIGDGSDPAWASRALTKLEDWARQARTS